MARRIFIVVAALAILLSARRAISQHLWWNLEGQQDAVCLYGEIEVLATHPGIYYCGANWHPGEPAGGYCGIQHNGPKERRTIFSIWDTTPELHPKVTEADSRTVVNRFGGEGTGAHTHMPWPWQTSEVFRFYVRKSPGATRGTIDASYFVYDNERKTWLAVATIASPSGDKKSVATFGGGLNSFLENFAGKDRTEPALALYRLWIGLSADKLHCLTRAKGDGKWGSLDDAYFLAEGSEQSLTTLFVKLEPKYGKPNFGGGKNSLRPISNRAVPEETIKGLQNLPRAAKVRE